MKKLFIASNGCYENILDTKEIKESFRENGWEIINDYNKANLIIFNTCAFEDTYEENSLQRIKEFQQNQKAELIVCGCLPKIDEKRLREIYQGPTFGPKEYHKIYELFNIKEREDSTNLLKKIDFRFQLIRGTIETIEKTKSALNKVLNKLNITFLPNFNMYEILGDEDAFFILTSKGCLGNCTFCGIKNAKGELESKNPERVEKEFKKGLREGYNKIVLLGDDVGSYGQDIGTNIVELVKNLLKNEGEYRIIMRNIEPQWLVSYFDGFKDICKNIRIQSVHLPLQSGSNKIIKKMGRNYDIDYCLDCINELKKINPKLLIRSEVMVGFPGETEKDFEETLSVLDKAKFDMFELFKYCEKSNTLAMYMDDKVSERDKKRRYKLFKRKMDSKIYFPKFKLFSTKK